MVPADVETENLEKIKLKNQEKREADLEIQLENQDVVEAEAEVEEPDVINH